MQALKALVYGMGILIVLAILLLTYGFYTRITDPNSKLIKDDDESPRPKRPWRPHSRARSGSRCQKGAQSLRCIHTANGSTFGQDRPEPVNGS